MERPTPPLPWYKQKPPPHISVRHIGIETTLDKMLDDGEIDALFSALVPPSMTRGSKNIARLFPDFEKAERDYYKTTCIFPIQHVVAIRKDVYKANPWIAASLYKAFKESRDKAYETYNNYLTMGRVDVVGATTTVRCEQTDSPAPPYTGSTYATGCPAITEDTSVELTLVAQ